MPDPLTLAALSAYLAKSAPSWLNSLRATLRDRGKEAAITKGISYGRSILHLDEKEQQRHLQIALKNAMERGLMQFHTREERDQYRNVLAILSEPGPHSDALRNEALRLFTLSDTPNDAELNEAYNRSLRSRALSKPTPPNEVEAGPFLDSFFSALIAELYIDPFFHQQISDVLKVRSAQGLQRSLTEVLATLRQIGEAITSEYTTEEFEHDVEVYVTHIERTFRYLKLVGVVPKDRSTENKDPELQEIFVSLRIMPLYPILLEERKRTSIVDLLEDSHQIILLGGPGTGKSTATRYLVWSHASANLPNSTTSLASIPLLSGRPVPLRIELRRLSEDRRQNPSYNFLSYTTEVLLEREGIEINPQMFKELLERRIMLLLFDGLDEVATLDERTRLVEEIEHFTQSYPGNYVLVTSRPVGYELAFFSDQWFSHAQVQDFDDDQIKLFLERWYASVLRLSPIPYEDQQELKTFLEVLKDTPRLHALATNPLLLTVITALHRYERLPDRRVLVYDRCADLLLDTWAKLKGTNARWRDMKLGKEDQYACIAHLGYVLQQRSQENETRKTLANDVTTKIILREILQFFERQKLFQSVVEQHTEATRFLELVQVEAGLIVERGKDEDNEALYGFVHRTFQEYFAAVDVHERYQQEADTTIINEFLVEHLHDPHWREVILLLFGKLKRKLATAQMYQLLEAKSLRSKYTDIIQQDLFFACDCLAEDIAVENELAELIVLRLNKLMRNSPFPSQREEAFTAITSLTRTRQYSTLAQKVLLTLLVQNAISNVSTAIGIARNLLLGNSLQPNERQIVSQIVLSLEQQELDSIHKQRAEISQETQEIEDDSDEVKTEISTFSAFQETQEIEDDSHEIKTKISEFLIAQASEVQSTSLGERSRELSTFFSGKNTLGSSSNIDDLEILSKKVKQTDVPFENAHWFAQLYFRGSPCSTDEERRNAAQPLLTLAQRSDLSPKQVLEVVQSLYEYSPSRTYAYYPDRPREWQQAIQISSDLTQDPHLTLEHVIQVVQYFYEYSPHFYEYSLHEYRPSRRKEWHRVTQMLSSLLQNPNLPVEQAIQVTEYLCWVSLGQPEKWEMAVQSLLDLGRHPNILMEQILQIAQYVYKYSPSNSSPRESAAQLFLGLVQRSNPPFAPIVQVARGFYREGVFEHEKLRLAIQMFLSLAQNESLTSQQRLAATTELLLTPETQYAERAQAVQIAITLLDKKTVDQYFTNNWRSISSSIKASISDIPFIAELAKQRLLSTKARDEMYLLLHELVPQFNLLLS